MSQAYLDAQKCDPSSNEALWGLLHLARAVHMPPAVLCEAVALRLDMLYDDDSSEGDSGAGADSDGGDLALALRCRPFAVRIKHLSSSATLNI